MKRKKMTEKQFKELTANGVFDEEEKYVLRKAFGMRVGDPPPSLQIDDGHEGRKAFYKRKFMLSIMKLPKVESKKS